MADLGVSAPVGKGIPMKITSAWRDAWKVYRAHPGDVLLTLFIQILFRLMAAAPLLLLSARETAVWSLLCLPLYILIVLPARQNAAEAMQDALDGGRMFSLRLVSTRDYGRKVLRGVKQALLLLLWGILWVAATALAVFVATGKTIEGVTDVFTLVRTLMALGGGSSIQGAKIVILIYLATLLPLMVGFAFHSGTRHAVALGDKSLVKGRRGGIMLLWLTGLATVIPFAAVTAAVGTSFASALFEALANIGTEAVALPPVGQNVYLIAAALVVLLLPLIPIKQLLPAAYLRGVKKGKA